MSDFRQDFLAFALVREVLRFGEFVTKAGRKSPYFFNAGLFNDGASLRELGRFYAQALRDSGLSCNGLFGPAYKGITLVAATAKPRMPLGWAARTFKMSESGMTSTNPLPRMFVDILSVRTVSSGRTCSWIAASMAR